MLDYFLLALAIVFLIIGIIGCLVPVLPGPPLSFAGILILHFTDFAEFRLNLLVILGVIAVVVAVFDYVVPIWGTKKFGGTKYGIRGATIGLLVGLFFGPPGIIIGPFLGAVIGEMIYKDDFNYAIRAGLGSLIGFMAGIGIKLATSLIITFYFIRGMF
ncbi:MAG: DUF456 domain-containing protein [Bacteroidales bacterium]|jgi:uncharacterized protein YqgC (DUF456 family)|nr:DUF456 domain-containing protein [Bacteroidales bacterium]